MRRSQTVFSRFPPPNQIFDSRDIFPCFPIRLRKRLHLEMPTAWNLRISLILSAGILQFNSANADIASSISLLQLIPCQRRKELTGVRVFKDISLVDLACHTCGPFSLTLLQKAVLKTEIETFIHSRQIADHEEWFEPLFMDQFCLRTISVNPQKLVRAVGYN